MLDWATSNMIIWHNTLFFKIDGSAMRPQSWPCLYGLENVTSSGLCVRLVYLLSMCSTSERRDIA